ncbi:MAG: hypothetical protein K9G33_10405 [Sneathiella sp.]|nr:hypothetical protein [Sneathiella sp.]
MRALTPDDKEQAFIKATRHFPDRYAEQIAKGMGDEALATALKNYLGIFGGSGARDGIDIAYQGAGLKIWASWNIPNSVMDKPIFEGHSTIAMARKVYGIANPDDDQLSLF